MIGGAETGLRGTVVAVSDSLTNDTPENWLALLRAKSETITVVANAHGGWTTRSYFKEKFRDVAFARIPADADVFLLLLGSNNLFEAGGGDDAAVAEAVVGIVKMAQRLQTLAPGAEIVLIAPPTVALCNNTTAEPKPERRIDVQSPACLEKLSRAYRDLAARRGWRFVDLFPLLGEDDFVDAAHPNASGNRKIAEAVWQALAARVADTESE